MTKFLMCYGPEFCSRTIPGLALRVGIQPIRIYPGSPWENGYNERFNGTLRREVLNAEWFTTTRQAQVVINQWLRQYNHVRPHHALGMRPPVPETILEKPQISGPDQGGWTLEEKRSCLGTVDQRPQAFYLRVLR